jgi:membrane protein implicated in regulation of membrane protease activity
MPVLWTILAAVLLLVPIASAFAYVDPGTGSMIIQVVIAALVGGAALIGAFWRKLFRRRRDPDDDPLETGKE